VSTAQFCICVHSCQHNYGSLAPTYLLCFVVCVRNMTTLRRHDEMCAPVCARVRARMLYAVLFVVTIVRLMESHMLFPGQLPKKVGSTHEAFGANHGTDSLSSGLPNVECVVSM
jgi:hypothetical protein